MARATAIDAAQCDRESSQSVTDTAPPAATKQAAAAAAERLHSTVRVNQFTLQFEDAALESAYKAFTHRRKKALWLRSLIPAAAFHILFGVGDSLEHPAAHLLVTIPARVFLSVLQLSMFVLVRWDLVRASETTMLLVSICNGIPTLLLYALQRSSLHQWDALFVVFGLSFYTIPKITPLGFVASLIGSWFTAILYAGLSFLVRPPTRPFESLLGFLYCAPVIGIFNTISYFSEYNSRERFVLRRRLRSESITLAVSRTNSLPAVTPASTDRFFKSILNANRGKFLFGVALWAAFTLGGWTSLPDMFKFVDEETGWAWFSHCAGMTVFLLVMTRQLQWLFVVPVFGALVLWMMSLTMPAYWIIISAHSVGYGLLIASTVVSMGVFSRFVFVWRELVSFLTRSCFLYPQLQAGLQDEYPLLVKIVSEYTAGMDPEIISSRDSTTRAITAGSPVPHEIAMRSLDQEHAHDGARTCAGSRSSPRRRMLVAATKAHSQRAPVHSPKQRSTSSDVAALHPVDQQPFELEDDVELMNNKMVSVLPCFKAGKCFFCSKNDAEHLVPACGMWGKWTHWRMSQQQDILYGSLALPGGAGSRSASGANGSALGKPAVAMCTSYYDVQQQKAQLEQRVAELQSETHQLRSSADEWKRHDQSATVSNVHLQAELRALEDKHAQELQRQRQMLTKKMDQILAESNHAAHEHKRELRDAEARTSQLKLQLEAALASADEWKSVAQAAEEKLAIQGTALTQSKDTNDTLRSEVTQLKQELEALRRNTPSVAGGGDSATTNPQACLETLQPSRRLPYARWLEIEGLRESAGKKAGDRTHGFLGFE